MKEWGQGGACLSSNSRLAAKKYPTLCHLVEPTRLFCPGEFPGKNTGVGCHFLLQGTFLPQELSSHLLHWQMGFFTSVPPRKFSLASYRPTSLASNCRPTSPSVTVIRALVTNHATYCLRAHDTKNSVCAHRSLNTRVRTCWWSPLLSLW